MEEKICAHHRAQRTIFKGDLASFAKKASHYYHRNEGVGGKGYKQALQLMEGAKENLRDMIPFILQCLDCQSLRGEAVPAEEQNGENDGAGKPNP